MGRAASVCLILMVLAGCSAQPAPTPDLDIIFASIKLVDSFPDRSPSTLALAKGTEHGFCSIEIRRDVYPRCITHEVMHCFSGNWHEGYETDEYCIVED